MLAADERGLTQIGKAKKQRVLISRHPDLSGPRSPRETKKHSLRKEEVARHGKARQRGDHPQMTQMYADGKGEETREARRARRKTCESEKVRK